jgi:hypothetical protein
VVWGFRVTCHGGSSGIDGSLRLDFVVVRVSE